MPEAITTSSPIVVLVRPQLGENIGKAARAMLNFGLTEMRLVTPRDGWPNPSAGPAASGADIVLERAQVFDSVAEAVADCPHVYATTVRKRGVTKPVVLAVTFNGGWAANAYDGARIGFSAKGALKRTDFGIGSGVPAPGTNMGVGDRIEVAIESEFSSGKPTGPTPPH